MNSKMIALLGAMAITASDIRAAEAQKEATPKPAAAAQNLFPDPVVGKGKGFEIKRSQVDEAYVRAKSSGSLRGQNISEEQRKEIEAQLLDQLIITQILSAKATAADKAKAKETTDNAIVEAKKHAPSEEAFNRQFTAAGTTLEKVRAEFEERAICQEVLERDIKALIPISDDQAKKFYEENAVKFEKPEMVRASHILIATQDLNTGQDLPEAKKKEKKQLADKILVRAKKGEDFAALAKEFSEDPGSKNNGGEYTFPRGQMVKEFEATAFSLKTNQISDLVLTQFGYHIIKLSEKIPAEKLAFAKVSEDIKKGLTQQEFQKQQGEFFDKLKKEAGVEIIDPNAKPKP